MEDIIDSMAKLMDMMKNVNKNMSDVQSQIQQQQEQLKIQGEELTKVVTRLDNLETREHIEDTNKTPQVLKRAHFKLDTAVKLEEAEFQKSIFSGKYSDPLEPSDEDILSETEEDDEVDGAVVKRKSALFGEIKDLITKSEIDVQFMRNPPSTKHIILDGVEPFKILKFYQDVVKIVHETNFIFKVQTSISTNVTNLICAKYNLSFYEYYSKSFDEIMNYLSEIVRPVNSNEFIALMLNNLECSGTLEKKNYINYYFSMLKYILDYTQLFKILAQNNKKNIPSINHSKYGLIVIFGYKIDKSYFNKVRSSMKIEKYNSIYLFLTEFKKVITEHYELHKMYLTLPGGKADYYNENSNNTEIIKPKNNHFQHKKFQKNNMVLNNIEMFDEESIDEEDSSNNDDDDDDISVFLDDSQNSNVIIDNESSSNDRLNAINTMIKKPAAAELPLCNNLLLYGKCLKDKDLKHLNTYSHDPNTLQRKSKELMERLRMRTNA